MTHNNSKINIRVSTLKNRRAAAEVISSLLLVAITVVGAVILTTFMDETFVSGGIAASGSDNTIKTIKLVKYDSRDGGNLLNIPNLNNTAFLNQTDTVLCRSSCQPTKNPISGGTQFVVIQIKNQSVNPIFLDKIWLDNIAHSWDSSTGGVILDPIGTVASGGIPSDGMFSIFPTSVNVGVTKQNIDNQIQGGQDVNILIKLDNSNSDIPLGKSIRTQFNIGGSYPSEFLIESGMAK